MGRFSRQDPGRWDWECRCHLTYPAFGKIDALHARGGLAWNVPSESVRGRHGGTVTSRDDRWAVRAVVAARRDARADPAAGGMGRPLCRRRRRHPVAVARVARVLARVLVVDVAGAVSLSRRWGLSGRRCAAVARLVFVEQTWVTRADMENE